MRETVARELRESTDDGKVRPERKRADVRVE